MTYVTMQPPLLDDSGAGFSMASILGFSIGGVSLLGFLLLIGFSCHKRVRKKHPAKWTAKDIKPLNSYEIPPERIELLEEVGQGAFGKVHKAKLIDGLEFFNKNTKDCCEKNFKYKIVAVKELHENANEEEKLEFLNEIDLMKVLGKSPNVLSFVGCWTEATPQKTPLRLIMEYVPHGDLLHWLRAKRSQIKGSTLGAVVITESKKQYAETKECNTATLDQGGEADGIKTVVLYENSCISTCAPEHEEIIASGNIDSASPLMCFPSTSAEDHKETITSSRNECVIPLIAISCPTTSGEGQKKALPSGNDECTIPFLSLPSISGEEYDETIASGNSKSTIPLSSIPPAYAGDDEGDLIGDINDESGIPLLNCSSTYPAGNEGTDIADGSNAIPLVVVSSSASNQKDVPTKNMGNECDEDCESFAPLDLIKLAWQIASGMKGLVHRDLAARNILVGHGKRVKIADFGLMRHLYHEVYKVDTGKKLPVKWMAPESIFEEIFTTRSDVWSYGVVLWEIATLGGSPYALKKHKEVLESLKSGYRLEKPDICTDRVYTLMTDCWNQDPDERPSFERLYKRLDDMLEEQAEYFSWDNHDESKYYYSTQASKTAEVDEVDNLEVANLPDVSKQGSNAAEADEAVIIQVEKPENVSKGQETEV
ncbi:tyrosine-protein kinase receptor torso-like [Montipora foliosa]|uniref:tyrosine-protein kinase receptor torso-like n=1 Tax=Montipora foliosa TaxID=591990 RepID=UPI0035F1E58C